MKFNKFKTYFQLFRIQNLVIIVALLYFMRHFVLKTFYNLGGFSFQVDSLSFFLFVLGYILLTAGGYAINDYYDVGIDDVNKKKSAVLGNKLPISFGRNSYFILTSIGFVISLWSILRIHSPKLIFVLLIITLFYWFYSTKYKREFLTGNIGISLLAFIGTAIVWLYEFFAGMANGALPILQIRMITYTTLIYALFAFLVTFIREIVKDMADIEGDKEFDCISLPIRYGIEKTKILLYILHALIMLGIIILLVYFFNLKYYFLLSFASLLFILFASNLRILSKAKTREDFMKTSDFLKIIFLAGILSMQLLSLEI